MSFQRHIEAARRLRDLNSEQGVQAALTCAEHAATTNVERAQLLAERWRDISAVERTIAANDPANGPVAVRALALTLID